MDAILFERLIESISLLKRYRSCKSDLFLLLIICIAILAISPAYLVSYVVCVIFVTAVWNLYKCRKEYNKSIDNILMRAGVTKIVIEKKK